MEDTEKMLREIRTVLLGVPGTEAKGMYQDMQALRENCLEIRDELRRINGAVKTNTAFRVASKWGFGVIITVLGFLMYLVAS